MLLVKFAQIKRGWLYIAVCCFCVLTLTVDTYATVLPQVPTPDVKTVPDLDAIVTPTVTALPAPVVTATAEPRPDGDVDPDQPATNAPATTAPGSAVLAAPILTPTLSITVSTAPTSAEMAATALVAAATLNVRALPSIGSPIVDQLKRDERVTLLEESADQLWWYICCGSTNNQQGWVNVQYLTITPTAALTTAPTETVATVQPPLQLQLAPRQRFVWQGQPLTLELAVTNPKTAIVRHLSMRTDLPPEIAFLRATTSLTGTQTIEDDANGGPVVTFNWPQIAPGAQVTATVELQVASQADNGAFITIMTAVDAEAQATLVAGVMVSMPPKQLPSFR